MARNRQREPDRDTADPEHMVTLRAKVYWTLSHWGPWICVAYLGLVLAGTSLYRLNQQTVKRDAARQSAIANCLTNRPLAQKFSRHVEGVNDLARVLVENSAHVLAATPKDDPQYMVRKTNLSRLIFARKKVEALPNIHVPTVAECRALGA